MANTRTKFNQLDLEGYSESGRTITNNVIASIGDFNNVNNGNFIRVDDGNNEILINGNDVIGFNKDIRISGSSSFFGRLTSDNLTTTNRTINLPNSEGTLVSSINGITADTFGNVNISVSGGTGSTITLDDDLNISSTNAVVNSAITTNINWLRTAQNFNELTKYETLPSVNRTYRVGSLNSALPDVSSIVFDRTFLHYNINGQRYLFVNKGSLQSGFNSTEGGFLEMLELEDTQLYVVMSSRVSFPPNSGLVTQANQDRFYLKTNEITSLSGVDSNYTVYETGSGTISSIDQDVANDNTINLSIVKQGFTGSTGTGGTYDDTNIRNAIALTSDESIDNGSYRNGTVRSEFPVNDFSTDITYDRNFIIVPGVTPYLLIDDGIISVTTFIQKYFDTSGSTLKGTVYGLENQTGNIDVYEKKNEFLLDTTPIPLTGLPSNYKAYALSNFSFFDGTVYDIPVFNDGKVTFSLLEQASEAPTGLEAIDEGNGIGWRLIGKNPANYGNIGLNAVDFSNSILTSIDNGATGQGSFAFGTNTEASGSFSFASGVNTEANAIYSSAIGLGTIASGADSHAQGANTRASGSHSHAEGSGSEATSTAAHAEGFNTIASGQYSHAEGFNTIASGENSHAQGRFTIASGDSSHAGGFGFGIGFEVKAEGLSSFNHSYVNQPGISGVTGDYSSILGGQNNTLTGTRSAIIGGSNITGTSNDTIYVPNLNIDSQPATGTSSTFLARTSGGSIVEVENINTNSGVFINGDVTLDDSSGTIIYSISNTTGNYYTIGNLFYFNLNIVGITSTGSGGGTFSIESPLLPAPNQGSPTDRTPLNLMRLTGTNLTNLPEIRAFTFGAGGINLTRIQDTSPSGFTVLMSGVEFPTSGNLGNINISGCYFI